MNQGIAFELSQVMGAAVDTGLFTSSITLQAPDGQRGPSGAPSGTYANVAGLVGLLCMDAPMSTGSGFSARETKAPGQVESEGDRHVLLSQYYAQLSPATNWGAAGWRAIVDGVTYDLKGAEADSQLTQTRLSLCKVTV